MMLVFGGNTHNGTSYSNGGQCFSADFQAYDIGMSTRRGFLCIKNLISKYCFYLSKILQ